MSKKVLKAKEGYNLYAPQYDGKKAFLDSFENNILGRFFQELKGKKVLDVGCGTGRTIGDLKKAGAKVVGVDPSEEMLKIAKKKFSDIEMIAGEIENLPCENESFDVVVALFVIAHLKTLDKAFREIYRVLKPGGVFIVSNINQKKAPVLKMGREEFVIDSFYHIPKNVVEMLEENWLKVEQEEFVHEDDVWINQIIKAVKI